MNKNSVLYLIASLNLRDIAERYKILNPNKVSASELSHAKQSVDYWAKEAQKRIVLFASDPRGW